MKRIQTLIYPYHWDVIGMYREAGNSHGERFAEYRRQWEQNPVKQVVSAFPLHLDIEVTGRCNLMCTHCVRHSRRTDIGDMDMDLFRRIIDEGAGYGLPSIIPHWLGESFLNRRLIDMIRYAKAKGVIDIRINTNCTLLNDETIEAILESGLDMIVCSIDAVEMDTYNRIKVGSDFNLINENVEKLIHLKRIRGMNRPKVVVQMIDMKKTHEELTAFIDYWRVRADVVRVATYQSPDGRPNDRNRVRNAPESIFPCPQLWQRLTIAWDGTVYSCLGDNACRDPLGNVRDTTLYDIWHGEKMNRLREMHGRYEADDIEKCSHCDLNKIPSTVKKYNTTGGPS